MVHFVGAGSGAADLITVRGAKLLGEADVRSVKGYAVLKPNAKQYKKLSCPQIAAQCSIQTKSVERVFRGERTTLKTAQEIAAALKCKPEKLFHIELDHRPIARKTIKEYAIFLRLVMQYAEREYGIDNDTQTLAVKGTRSRPVDCLHPEEVEALFKVLPRCSTLEQVIIMGLLNTGMRRGELCALRWSDVIVTGSYKGYIIVRHSRSTVSGEGVQEGKTKNGRTRTVSMNEEMFSLLRGFCYRKMRLRDESGIPFPEYIFTKDDGTPIHPDTFSKHLKALFAEIGLPKTYHLHTLRHFFVSTLLHEGVDKNTVADLAGHGDTSFLERTYCHPQMQRKQDAAKRMAECLIPTQSAAQMVS